METKHTPGCTGHERPIFRASDRNRRITSHQFQYLHCGTCDLIRLACIPDDLGQYYPNTYYEMPSFDRIAAIAAKDPFKIETVRRHSRPGRLLEIGPAWGTFALQAKQAGYRTTAIEMDSACCDFLNRTIGIDAVCSDAPHEAMAKLPPQDVIALWHVIEHLPDPWALLDAAAANLAPNGILVIASPNPGAWQFHVMGRQWPHLDAPRHLYLLPAETLAGYAAAAGLVCIETTTQDKDAKRWNRFGWQRLLMNSVQGKWLQRGAYIAGFGLSALLAPFESGRANGSAYTLVLRKQDL